MLELPGFHLFAIEADMESARAPKAKKQVAAAAAGNGDAGADAGGQGATLDNSLNVLTSRFVAYLRTAKAGTADLTTAATKLQVPKRRLYDITNVLEGIGLIEKREKNIVIWW